MEIIAALASQEDDSLLVARLAKCPGLSGVAALNGASVHHHQQATLLIVPEFDSLDVVKVELVAHLLKCFYNLLVVRNLLLRFISDLAVNSNLC